MLNILKYLTQVLCYLKSVIYTFLYDDYDHIKQQLKSSPINWTADEQA